MADDVKTTVTVIPAVTAKPAEAAKPAAPAAKAPEVKKPAAKKPAAKKPAAKKPAAKKAAAKKAAPKAAAKPVAKKAAAKPAAKATAKPVAKKAAAKPGRKPAAKKAVAKKAPVKAAAKAAPAKGKVAAAPVKGKGGRKKAAPSLDIVTTAIWKKIGKASVRALEAPVGIQVNVHDIGTFFIAVRADSGKKQLAVEQAIYNDRAGTVEISYEEVMKVAAGKYNFLDAITKGKVYYYGDIAKAVAIAGLFK
jgi:hypothetical protein